MCLQIEILIAFLRGGEALQAEENKNQMNSV